MGFSTALSEASIVTILDRLVDPTILVTIHERLTKESKEAVAEGSEPSRCNTSRSKTKLLSNKGKIAFLPEYKRDSGCM